MTPIVLKRKDTFKSFLLQLIDSNNSLNRIGNQRHFDIFSCEIHLFLTRNKNMREILRQLGLSL